MKKINKKLDFVDFEELVKYHQYLLKFQADTTNSIETPRPFGQFVFNAQTPETDCFNFMWHILYKYIKCYFWDKIIGRLDYSQRTNFYKKLLWITALCLVNGRKNKIISVLLKLEQHLKNYKKQELK